MKQITRSHLVAIAAMLLCAASRAGPIDPKFSIDPASPSINGSITPDDVLKPSPIIHTEGRSLGLQDDFFAGVFDNLADFSFGQDPIRNPLFFSVDRVSVGLPGSAVFDQAQPGTASAAGDVYVALPPFGTDSLFIAESGLGLIPGFFGDDLDGLELDTKPNPFVFFAIDRLSATNGFGAGDLANDILISARDGGFSIFRPDVLIGLLAGDAIDGLVLDVANDAALFSLDPFSPSTFTFTGLEYAPCVPGRMSPADVCLTRFDGRYSLWVSAAGIGLRSDDNVDALDTRVSSPSTFVLLCGGFLILSFFVRGPRITH